MEPDEVQVLERPLRDRDGRSGTNAVVFVLESGWNQDECSVVGVFATEGGAKVASHHIEWSERQDGGWFATDNAWPTCRANYCSVTPWIVDA